MRTLIPRRMLLRPLLVLCLSLLALQPVQANIDALSYSDEQAKTAVEIVRQLEYRHYQGKRFDDALSSKLLDNYLARLDSNKIFFLQSDIREFEQYRLVLDEQTRKGRLDAGFAIYNRFQQRVIARLEATLEQLPAMIAAMDFERDESLELDRKTAQWPVSAAAADDLWRKRIKSQVLSLRLAKKPQEEILPLLEKRFKNQLNRLRQANAEDAFDAYVNALTELYDPHTNYFSPATSENFNINMSLSLEGIGAVLQTENEYTKVVRLVHAGPADKQGQLQPSDRITAVAQGRDGEFEDVIGLRLDDVVKLIRGPKHSIVRLEIIPVSAASDDERKIVEIQRDTVKLEEQSAKKHMLEIFSDERLIKVGVIDIPTFYFDFDAWRRGDEDFKSTTRDVQRLLDELLADGAEGVIIDLRENGGGSLNEAHALTGLFIERGATVQIRHSSTQVKRMVKSRSTAFYSGPLVVLINRLSASASEIFAGAIQDYQRGIIIGNQSFGKGTVQSLTPLHHGQLKITEQKFYRISGESTQHRGVVPDIDFPALYDMEKVGESSLENALPWDHINPVRHDDYFDIQSHIPELRQKHQQRIKNDPDFAFLRSQISLNEKARERKQLSLKESERLAQQNEEKTLVLAMENQRRAAKGLPLLDKLEKSDDEDSEAANEPDHGPDNANPADDPLLLESANILVDSLPIYQHKQFAAQLQADSAQ